MLGFGGCGFTPIDYYEVPGSSTGSLRAADMNGDGTLDIVSISAVLASDPSAAVQDNLLTVLLGHPDGTFQLQDGAISLGPLISDVAVGDVTGDGRPDLVVASGDEQTGQIGTWENTCQ